MLAVPRNAADCVVQDLATLVQTATDKAGCPNASSITQGVPIYKSASLRARLAQDDAAGSFRRALMAEWAHVWSDGPGILMWQAVYDDAALVDAVSAEFRLMIAEAYAFPTNLDRAPPIGGLAAESQQALLLRGLQEGWPLQQFMNAAQTQAARKIA